MRRRGSCSCYYDWSSDARRADAARRSQYGYNSHVRSVNVAELKNRLSAYLQEVRAGEELVIRDRNLPVARIVPIESGDLDPDEASLVASGLMRLPKRPLDFERFWAIGGRARRNAKTLKAISLAM